MKKFYTLFLALTVLICTASAATTIYVSSGATGGGTSWSDTKDLAAAISAASSTDEIWVKGGTYLLSSQININASTRIIYGGFAGTESATTERSASDLDGNGAIEPWEFTNLSILDGQGACQVLRVSTNNSVINGLVIQNGFYNYSGTGTLTGVAAGLQIDGGQSNTITVSNCIVRNNLLTGTGMTGATAYPDGAPGVRMSGPLVTMNGCLIEKNILDMTTVVAGLTTNPTTTGAGVIMVNSTLKNSIVRNNLSKTKLVNAGQNPTNRSAGIFAKYSTSSNTNKVLPQVVNCVIANNECRTYGQTSGLAGAGLYLYDAGYVQNCTVVNNKLTPYVNADGTGGLASFGDGAGLYVRLASTPAADFPNRYVHNTVCWGNYSPAPVVSGEYKSQIYVNTTINWSTTEFKNVITTENYYGASVKDVDCANGGDKKHTVTDCIINASTDNAILKFKSPSSFAGNGTDAEVKANWQIDLQSFLTGKGLPITLPVVLTTDLMGANYITSTPAVGAYEAKDLGTRINQIDNSTSAFRSKNILYGIEAGDKVMAYTVTGTLVMNKISTDSQLEMPCNGYFVVKVIKKNGQVLSIK